MGVGFSYVSLEVGYRKVTKIKKKEQFIIIRRCFGFGKRWWLSQMFKFLATTLDIMFKTYKASFRNVPEFMDAMPSGTINWNWVLSHLYQLLFRNKTICLGTLGTQYLLLQRLYVSPNKKIWISALYSGVLEAEPSVTGITEKRLKERKRASTRSSR